MSTQDIIFINNLSLQGRENDFCISSVNTQRVLESWKHSLFSYEWLQPDGSLKDIAELADKERQKRKTIEKNIQNAQEIQRPVLGIGLLDNVEIGIGKEIFLTLAAHNFLFVQVHIPVDHAAEFKSFEV